MTTTSSSNIIAVDFGADTLWAVDRTGVVYVAITPICRTLGLAPNRQQHRIDRDAILAEGRTIMVLPSPGGPQEMLCLRLDLVNGWLFGVDEGRRTA